MTILFDLSAAQLGRNDGFHGGGEYAKVVFYRLCESLPPDVSLEVFYDPRRNFDDNILEICNAKGFITNACSSNAEKSKLLCSKKYDVFYSALPYGFYDLIIPPETIFIYTIHGLRALEYLDDKYELKYTKNRRKIIKHILFSIFPAFMKKYKPKRNISKLNALFSLTENQKIITISNHSKYAIFLFFPAIDISKIKVFYSPLKISKINEEKEAEILNSFSLKTNKYILLINGDRSTKGAYRAYRVLNNIFMKQNSIPEDIKVIILGVSHKKPYRKLNKNTSRFKIHGYVSTEELEILYKNACLFLFPTMNEGFGYPPLEAMKYGTLCACSANSSITEIYGDSVIYFNPFDETEMSIRILQSFDKDIRREKSEKMAARYKLIRERQEKDLQALIDTILSK